MPALAGAMSGCDAGPYIRNCDPTLPSCGAPIDAGMALDVRVFEVRTLDADDPYAGLQSITVTPDNPTLTVRGTPTTQVFMAVGHYIDGTTRPLPLGTWSVDRAFAGSMDPDTGRFTANGQVGDAVHVDVQVPRPSGVALHGTTTLTVRYERDVLVTPSTDAARSLFGAPVTDASRAVVLRYPLDGARMPQNVAAPDVQWEGGAAGDVYRVRLVKPHATVTGYVTHTGAAFRFDWGVDASGWRAIVESDPTSPATLTADRATGGAAVAGAPVTLQIAQGSLAGAVYYWDLRAGKILRVRETPTGPVREDFLPRPPARRSDGSRCVACHTVSRDGLQMAAELWEGQGPSSVFDLTADLSRDPAPTRFTPNETTNQPSWVYGSFNADATRLIANRLGGLFLVDPATGSTVSPRAGTLPQGNSVQPSWSPDGHTIAYVANAVGPGPTAFAASDLATINVTAADSFDAPVQRVPGASLAARAERGNAVAYPTWTPDSRWIAFQHGPYSESDRDLGGGMPRMRYPSALYLVGPSGGAPTRLDRASQDAAGDDAYFPNFSPFIQGGQYWLMYFSRRDYGNVQAGTRGTGRRQLWVTAISASPTAGTDPSSTPYWLPGQDVASDNVSGFWAPQPCRSRGMSCTVSSECCAGSCSANAAGALVCNPPPPQAPCRGERERCGASGDCCDGLACAANVCLRPPG